ncbi:MAG TPA: restriction endonuclease subunit M [Bacteroidales bacterium]|nr:restriction endonuclease subunit M [Bacteroidales bacterium]
MSLFQTSVIKKYLSDLSPELIDKKYNEFQSYFGNAQIQENIRNLKEEEYQEGFIRELFVKIFEYTLNPEPNYNIVLEKKNVDDSKKADGAIIRDNEVIAVIELKSTQTTNLDSFRDQAFGYKNHNPKCVYIITSNFEKIRLYIHDTIYHEEFNLFNLPKERFALLWLCFSKDNILKDIPLKIKEASVLQEENVTKKLYNDYSKFREEIFNDIVKNNPEFDKLVLFKKTQKLLDRFLFIFFAEDRLLLPPNSISEIVKQWKTLKDDLDEYVPLYDRFKKYFGYLNTGYKGKKYDIFPYNGGLFAPDEILDNIKINDEILHKHTLQLSTYDFETDVDVNILGHIFEHSLGEIENVQAEIEGKAVETQKTKRKKDGIFYTPKYITKYIVENTVGKLCEEKRTELEIIDEEFAKGRKNRKKEIVKELDNKLTEYREWLLNITILDPACGSGAFLNQALEFLIEEHKKIDELKAQLLGGSIVFSDIEAKILEKNIYGVDLNEESVEIAKLSLWLRTAQKGRKLTTLSNHIKCGNSLIDDTEIAGEKAFKWQIEFPEVFKNGGFDIVIGNPPYGAKIPRNHIDYVANKFKNYFSGEVDTYIVFYFSSIQLLRPKGLLGFITPDTWLTISRGKGLRDYILENTTLLDIYDRYKPFQDAKDTRCHTLCLEKSKKDNYNFTVIVVDAKENILKSYLLDKQRIKNTESWNLYISNAENTIFEKMWSNSKKLSELYNLKYGLRTGNNEKYLSNSDNNGLGIKIARGSHIERYYFNWIPEFLLTKEDLPISYFEPNILTSEKIIVQYVRTNSTKINSRWLEATLIDDKNFVALNSTSFISRKESDYEIKWLLPIISSWLLNFYYKAHYTDVNVKPLYLSELPIPISTEHSEELIELTDTIIELNKNLRSKSKIFTDLMLSKYHFEIYPNKFNEWYKLDFQQIISELRKIKITLSLKDEAEWQQFFIHEQAELKSIISEIEKTDRLIDQLVYKIYGLNDEDIRIVERTLQP